MARSRNIKPGFFSNEELVELPFEYRLLFAGIWTLADREGRLEDRPKRIKMELFPADNIDVEDGLSELSRRGFIERYEVNGNRYICVSNWKKHQQPHVKEKASTLPAPCKPGVSAPTCTDESTVQAPGATGASPSDSLIPDSLIPDSKEEDAPPPAAARKHTDDPPVISAEQLQALEVPEAVAREFLKLRKTKKAPFTELALEGIQREAKKAGYTLTEALRKCVERGWQGFEAEWVQGGSKGNSSKPGGMVPAGPKDYGKGVSADGKF